MYHTNPSTSSSNPPASLTSIASGPFRINMWPYHICDVFLVPLAALEDDRMSSSQAQILLEYLHTSLRFMEERGINDPELAAAIEACIDKTSALLAAGKASSWVFGAARRMQLEMLVHEGHSLAEDILPRRRKREAEERKCKMQREAEKSIYEKRAE